MQVEGTKILFTKLLRCSAQVLVTDWLPFGWAQDHKRGNSVNYTHILYEPLKYVTHYSYYIFYIALILLERVFYSTFPVGWSEKMRSKAFFTFLLNILWLVVHFSHFFDTLWETDFRLTFPLANNIDKIWTVYVGWTIIRGYILLLEKTGRLTEILPYFTCIVLLYALYNDAAWHKNYNSQSKSRRQKKVCLHAWSKDVSLLNSFKVSWLVNIGIKKFQN